ARSKPAAAKRTRSSRTAAGTITPTATTPTAATPAPAAPFGTPARCFKTLAPRIVILALLGSQHRQRILLDVYLHHAPKCFAIQFLLIGVELRQHRTAGRRRRIIRAHRNHRHHRRRRH